MALTLYFASKFYSAMDIIFPKLPSETPDGLITVFIIIPITWICISSQLIIACVHIMKKITKTKCKRRHKRLIESAARQKLMKKLRRALLQFFRKYLVLQQYLAQQEKISASEGYPQVDESIYYTSSDGEIHVTASSKSGNVNSHQTESSVSSYSGYNNLHGFTTSFTNADADQINIQVPFDTYSIFFVCDNSTTGHIFNDLLNFIPGTLHQTNRRLTAVNGTGPPVQEGTIKIHLTNDDGKVHFFSGRMHLSSRITSKLAINQTIS